MYRVEFYLKSKSAEMAAKVACSPGSWNGSKSEQACWGINVSSHVNIGLTTERDFDSQATWVIDVLGLYFDVIQGCGYNEALADDRATGAGIKCIYCNLLIHALNACAAQA